MGETLDYSALHWIKRELDKALTRAAQVLETYVEVSDDPNDLVQCSEAFHQVNGTLRMVELYSAAMLCEEMEAVSRALTAEEIPDRENACEVLMRATLLLPDYLEKLQAGQKDVPLVLLPLLNDLRASRGAKLLTESAFFAPDLGLLLASQAEPPEADAAGSRKIRLLRHRLHMGLLPVLRGDDPRGGCAQILQVIDQLHEQARCVGTAQLWRIAGAFLDVLITQEAVSPAVRPILGQIDHQIRRLIEDGEGELAERPNLQLAKNLLYYVATAESPTARVVEVQTDYGLAEALPSETEVETAQHSLATPNEEMMNTVVQAISEDIATVKDGLDLYVRGTKSDPDSLQKQAEQLGTVGDTLAMIGAGALRVIVKDQAEALARLAADADAAGDGAIMEIASELLVVESRLQQGLLQSASAHAPAAMDDRPAEYVAVTDATLHEIMVEMAHAKEAVVCFMGAAEGESHLEALRENFERIRGALTMLAESRAKDLLAAVSDYVGETLIGRSSKPDLATMELLADAITSIEYYLESIHERRLNSPEILSIAERSLEELRETACLTQRDLTDQQPPADEPAATVGDPQPAPEQSADEADAAFAITQDAPVALEVDDGLDEEILEIFLEEAREELDVIAENLPRWQASPEDDESLKTIRRSFHTLKGSGRMVGATRVGDLAWAAENMLNRLIDGTVPTTPAVFDAIRDTASALPAMLSALQSGTDGGADLSGLIERLEALGAADAESESSSEPSSAAGLLVDPAEAEAEAEVQVVADACEEMLAATEVGDLEQQEKGAGTGTDVPSEAELAEPAAGAAVDPVEEPADALDPVDEADDSLACAPQQGDQEVGADWVATPADDPSGSAETEDVVTDAEDEPIDPILLEIFSSETQDHLAEIRVFIERCRASDGACRIDDEVVRALHTMQGSAHMAGVGNIATLSRELEKSAKVLRAREALLGKERVDELEVIVGAIEQALKALGTATGEQLDLDGLLERIQALPSMTVTVPLVQAAETQETPRDGLPPDDPALEEPAASKAAVDDELLEMFQEEARELLESIEEGVVAWIGEPSDLAHVELLQRNLHTLKGNARLTGVAAIGDLSHGLETMLTAVMKRDMEPSESVRGAVQRGVDGIVSLMERLGDARRPRAAEPYLHQLEAVLSPQSAASSTPAPREDQHGGGAKAEPAGRESIRREGRGRRKGDQIRVRADLMDQMVNNAGEVSIYRARLEEQNSALHFNITELDQTITRLNDQLRKLDMETETQILFRHEREDTDAAEEFDPLELDRYSRIQQLSRSLMESVSDLLNLKEGIGSLARQSETLLRQQARVSTDLQEALMRTRMVPFSSVLSRLRRVVRQNAEQMGKSATLRVEGTEGEMDRSVLDRLIAPIEHMLRNSLAHGIETAAERAQVDKPEVGSIDLRFAREGNQVVLEVRDDGRGIDLAAVRRKAAETGLLSEADDPAVSDHDAMQLIFEPGFSTATAVTQISGRGVGMDVVTSEIKQLGGSLQIDSTAGKGTTISVRLPFTLAITQALLVKVGDRTYAVPYTAVEGVVRLGRDSLEQYLTGQKSGYVYAGNRYEILNLAHVLSGEPIQFDGQEKWFPTLLVKAGEHRAALQVDGLLGMREIVVKSVGPQLSTVSWIAGGTILADGDVALILDASTLVRLWAVQQSEGRSTLVTQPASDSLSAQQPATATTVMVVDDSLTVRKVTGRLLERRGMNVIAAKDGVDAVARLQETIPDVMLLDVEMPRMDGYELTRHIRNSERLRGVPIIMITSRTGQKHRRKAEELGVDRYLGKPYQESDLLATIDGLLTERMGG